MAILWSKSRDSFSNNQLGVDFSIEFQERSRSSLFRQISPGFRPYDSDVASCRSKHRLGHVDHHHIDGWTVKRDKANSSPVGKVMETTSQISNPKVSSLRDVLCPVDLLRSNLKMVEYDILHVNGIYR